LPVAYERTLHFPPLLVRKSFFLHRTGLVELPSIAATLPVSEVYRDPLAGP